MSTVGEFLQRANCGIIGIDEKGQVFGGYDQQFDGASNDMPDWVFDPEEWDQMPTAERVALADEMLRRWSAYRATALKP